MNDIDCIYKRLEIIENIVKMLTDEVNIMRSEMANLYDEVDELREEEECSCKCDSSVDTPSKTLYRALHCTISGW